MAIPSLGGQNQDGGHLQRPLPSKDPPARKKTAASTDSTLSNPSLGPALDTYDAAKTLQMVSLSKKSHSVSVQPIEDDPSGHIFFNPSFLRMLIFIKVEGLRLRGNIAADGNCMFSSLSDQLSKQRGVSIPPTAIRRTIANFLRSNPRSMHDTHLKEFLDEPWDTYLTSMATTQRWGDHIMLFGAASLFDVEIRVISSLGKHGNQIINAESDARGEHDVIMLGHIAECHYVSLEPDQLADTVMGKCEIKPGESTDGYCGSGEADLATAKKVLLVKKDEDTNAISSILSPSLALISAKALVEDTVDLLITEEKGCSKLSQVTPMISLEDPDVPDYVVTWISNNVALPGSVLDYKQETSGQMYVRLMCNSEGNTDENQFVSSKTVRAMPPKLFGSIGSVLSKFGLFKPEVASSALDLKVEDNKLYVKNDVDGDDASECTNQNLIPPGTGSNGLQNISKTLNGILSRSLALLSSVKFQVALDCLNWPCIANTWPSRSRSWPAKQVVDEIIKRGILIVPDENDDSVEKYKFLLSFERAEQMLMDSFSHNQRECFRLMCFLRRNILTDIKPAHVKHLLFLACETLEPVMWDQKTRVDNVKLVVGILKDCLVPGHYLPHFFVNGVNMFEDLSVQTRSLLSEQCDKIMKDPLDHLVPRNAVERKLDFCKTPGRITLTGKELLYKRTSVEDMEGTL